MFDVVAQTFLLFNIKTVSDSVNIYEGVTVRFINV